ncbi:MAG TPA: MoxR family ATPase [Candidatus Limnocylindrales bacterium]|nr:MoxR family ATPase [Candidatus Limnocylindrales bacterium]
MADQVARVAEHIRKEMGKAIVGQRAVLDQMLLVLLCGGHALIEGVPGLAKTLAVKVLALIGRLEFRRVQCTPDLMPADIQGTTIFNVQKGEFSLHRGPIFTDLLLVDEINRTPPRTQSALLEAMEERQVTLDGNTYMLSDFFTVFATQNPIEFEGTYPLPEAQLDRFLLKIRIGYPEAGEESEILRHYQEGFDPRGLDKLGLEQLPAGWLLAARAEVGAVRVEPALFQYVTNVVRRSRDWPALSLGASPRAAVNLLLAAKACASLEGRDFLIPDDVKTAAPAVLRHRLLLKPESDLEGMNSDQVIAELLAAVEVPK